MAFLLLIALLLLISLQPPGRRGVLRAAIWMGGLIVAFVEFLSLFKWLTGFGLAITWGGVILCLLGWHVRHRWESVASWRKWLATRQFPKDGPTRFLLAGILILVLAVGAMAFLTPVQTPDSQTYHLSRVAHWAQDHSVGIYATGIERQNFMSPYAEFAVLNLYVLQGADTFVNIPNFLVYLGILLGVSWIAAQLGASNRGQWIAAVFAAVIPMAISQASSTATDLVTAFWLVCLTAELLSILEELPRESKIGLSSWIPAGGALGLATLTKPTGVIFAIPVVFWAGIRVLQSRKLKLLAVVGAAVTLLVCVGLVNLGYFSRNIAAYGNPLGPAEAVSYQANTVFTPGVLLSNTVRNLSLHLGSIGPLDHLLTTAIERVDGWVGVDPNDPRTTLSQPFQVKGPRNEDNIGNLVPLGVILLTIVLLLTWRKVDRRVSGLILCLVVGYLLFSILNKWQLFGSRLQTPFFVLFAPMVGYLASMERFQRWSFPLGAFLLVTGLPWALFLFQRPIIPIPGITYRSSILNTPRQELYYANSGLPEEYANIAHQISGAGCSQVGLMLTGDYPEYLLWVALKPYANQGMQIEWQVAGTPSARYAPADYSPCALIVNDRPAVAELDGLPLVFQGQDLQLYLR